MERARKKWKVQEYPPIPSPRLLFRYLQNCTRTIVPSNALQSPLQQRGASLLLLEVKHESRKPTTETGYAPKKSSAPLPVEVALAIATAALQDGGLCFATYVLLAFFGHVAHRRDFFFSSE